LILSAPRLAIDSSSKAAETAEKPPNTTKTAEAEKLLSSSTKPNRKPPVFRYVILYVVLVILLLILSVLLLVGLVFRYLVDLSPRSARSFPWDITSTDSYYIEYSLSRLLTIASWMATVSILMPGFIMAILSYVIAKKWHAASLNTSKSFSGTPTLMQLAILVKVIGAGGIGSLWKFLGYQYTSSKKHPTPPLLKASAHVLAVALLIGWVVTATDTWLHAASSTVLLATSKAAAPGEEKSYGRGLSAECLKLMGFYLNGPRAGATVGPCNVYGAGNGGAQLLNSEQSMTAVLNISSNNTVVLRYGSWGEPCACILWYREERRRTTRDIYRRHQPLQP
jgi:hypothetical protein